MEPHGAIALVVETERLPIAVEEGFAAEGDHELRAVAASVFVHDDAMIRRKTNDCQPP